MDKKSIVFLTIVAILVATVVLRSKNKRGKSRQSTESSLAETNALATLPSVSSQNNKTYSSTESKGSNLRVPQAPVIGAAYVKDENGRRYLTVELSPINQCHQGDADAMLTLSRNTGSKIIATLEPVDVKDLSKAVVKEITASDLSLGTNFALEVKEDSPKVFGLYVCSDGLNSKSCRNKSPAKLVFGYESFLSSLEAQGAKDFVFFIHLLVLDKDNYQVYQSDFEINSIVKTISSALRKSDLSEQEMLTAREISKLLKSIRPYPIAALNDATVGTVLRMSVTRKDASMCSY